jgi:hypothetical protein
VKELADGLLTQGPDLKGFSASNLWRTEQIYEAYRDESKLAPLVRLLPMDAWAKIKRMCISRLKFSSAGIMV